MNEVWNYRGHLYFPVSAVAEIFGGVSGVPSSDVPLGIRPLEIKTAKKTLLFEAGGTQIKVVENSSDSEVEPLLEPMEYALLVSQSELFCPADVLEKHLGCMVSKADDSIVRLSRMDGGVVQYSVLFRLVDIGLKSSRQVSNLRPATGIWELLEAIDVYRRLPHKSDGQFENGSTSCQNQLESPIFELARGSLLRERRRFDFDGQEHVILDETIPPYFPVVVSAAKLAEDAKQVLNADTEIDLLQLQANARRFALKTSAIDRLFDVNIEDATQTLESTSDRKPTHPLFSGVVRPTSDKAIRIALTVDFCWSIRPAETELIKLLHELAEDPAEREVVTFFMSGRWVDQHPSEMSLLVSLAERNGIDIFWGPHSYEHPKYGKFLNAFSPEELREDTLKNELAMLRYGILPCCFYRFPGLYYDEIRATTIADMSLIPIDCSAWVAIGYDGDGEEKTSSQQYGRPIDDGGIVLVHGNGNEPQGINGFVGWHAKQKAVSLQPIGFTASQESKDKS